MEIFGETSYFFTIMFVLNVLADYADFFLKNIHNHLQDLQNPREKNYFFNAFPILIYKKDIIKKKIVTNNELIKTFGKPKAVTSTKG